MEKLIQKVLKLTQFPKVSKLDTLPLLTPSNHGKTQNVFENEQKLKMRGGISKVEEFFQNYLCSWEWYMAFTAQSMVEYAGIRLLNPLSSQEG